MPTLSRTAVLTLVVAWAAACGGQSQVTGDEEAGGEGGTGASGGTGGSSKAGTSGKGTGGSGAVGGSTGGSGAVGGSTGGSGAVGGSTGGTGAVGGSMGGTGAVDPVGGSAGAGASGGFAGSLICCTAAPTCGANEQEISGPAACPPGAMCHAVSVCCSTIWCASEVSQCDAVPSCDEGDTTLEGPCPPDVACYSRSLCGSTVWCIDECNPETEFNRSYIGADPRECLLLDFACGGGTSHFQNECGCGCEQDASCPETFYCEPPAMDTAEAAPGQTPPGAAPPPLPQRCDPAALMRCPLTEIVVPQL
jgi:hypothetical protein